MNPPFVIGIVEDDDSVRRSLRRLLGAEGWLVRDFASAADFLAAPKLGEIDCLLLDVGLPCLSGIELHTKLVEAGCRLPVVFLTGAGDIPSCVDAMKNGAIDFLTKSVEDKTLLQAIKAAADEGRNRREQSRKMSGEKARLASLTRREIEVFRRVITGNINKKTAAHMGISEQTVKIHRMRIGQKINLQSVADWVRLAERHGIAPINGEAQLDDGDGRSLDCSQILA
jgi:FixJ family two-component response regulator